MGQEIDLLRNYPRTTRNVEERGNTKSDMDRIIARQFGKEFFDGDRKHGYGGFNYNARYWSTVVCDIQDHFNIKSYDSILDVGCAKGFMLFDFFKKIPEITIRGLDISSYAIENSLEKVRSLLDIGDAKALPYQSDSFDVVISINTIHNLDLPECMLALQEIERVKKRGSFITVDAFRTDEERTRMLAWNLTAKTILHVDEWKDLFSKVGYTGDYYWFVP